MSPKTEKIHLLRPIFLGVENISVIFFKSNLYIQYHCLPLIRNVNKLDSLCHSISFKTKFEFSKIFTHHVTGIKHESKSPHLPWGLNVVAILGLNFNVLYLTILAVIK